MRIVIKSFAVAVAFQSVVAFAASRDCSLQNVDATLEVQKSYHVATCDKGSYSGYVDPAAQINSFRARVNYRDGRSEFIERADTSGLGITVPDLSDRRGQAKLLKGARLSQSPGDALSVTVERFGLDVRTVLYADGNLTRPNKPSPVPNSGMTCEYVSLPRVISQVGCATPICVGSIKCTRADGTPASGIAACPATRGSGRYGAEPKNMRCPLASQCGADTTVTVESGKQAVDETLLRAGDIDGAPRTGSGL